MRLARLTVRTAIIALAVLAWPSAAFAAGWQAPFTVGSQRDPAGFVAVNDEGYAAFVSGLRAQHEPARWLTLRSSIPATSSRPAGSPCLPPLCQARLRR